MKRTRWLGLLVLLGLLVSACTAGVGAGASSSGETTSGGGTDRPEIEPTSQAGGEADPEAAESSGNSALTCEDPFPEGQPSFPTSYWDETDFCKHSVDYDSIISGGPPPDGIPPIDEPTFEDVASADEWLEDVEPVITLEINDDARAYPLQIMTWHEIVNDRVGGVPVVVTFCPLCNTALTFERPEVDGERLTFGTSGNLRNSDLVMYDRQTESWWQQFSGEAIVGDLTGTQLKFLPVAINSWEDFQSKHPEGRVLSIETGFNRNYGTNPYVGYDDVNASPFLFRGQVDDQLPPMARVVGVMGEGDQGKGYSLADLQEERVINDSLGDQPIVIFWKSGTASALDSRSIPEGDDVGSTGVYLARVEDQELTFEVDEDGNFVDQETGSTWDLFGEAQQGPLAGSQLEKIPHHDTFWFVWSTFQGPDSLQQ